MEFWRRTGNVTGTAWAPTPEIVDKSLEWLNESVPRLARVSLVWEPGVPGQDIYVRSLESAALRLNIAARKMQLRTISELENVFAAVRQHQAQAVIVSGRQLFFRISTTSWSAHGDSDFLTSIFSGKRYWPAD
jgi:hypothetical protein